jgi:hypothetical protein
MATVRSLHTHSPIAQHCVPTTAKTLTRNTVEYKRNRIRNEDAGILRIVQITLRLDHGDA